MRTAQSCLAQEASREQVRQWMQLKGIGINGAWLWGLALFGGRGSIVARWVAEQA